MVGYYIKMALRSLRRYGFHSSISVLSLTLGFVCFIAANVFAEYLLSWDRHFPDSERIFTVNSSSPNPRTNGLPLVPRHVATYLKNDFPEIQFTTTQRLSAGYNVTIDNVTDTLSVQFVEGDYLEIFPLRFVETSADGFAELRPNTALIMESAALAHFGTTDVVGKRLVIGQRHELNIAGVVETMSRPSHLRSILPGNRSELIVPMGVFDALANSGSVPAESWHDRSYRAYVKVADYVSLNSEDYAGRLAAFSGSHVPETSYASGPHQTLFSFHSLEETAPAYLKLLFGNVPVDRLVFAIGLLVLLVACLNYSNLVIAQLTRRSHEIAVQKVTGAKRRQVLAQYGIEGLLVAGLSFVLALAICGIVLSTEDTLRATGFHIGLLLTSRMWLTSVASLVIIVFIASTYPVLRVTRHSMSGMLRGASAGSYSHRLRSLIVGTQFAFSSMFLILAMFIFSQNNTLLRQATSDSLNSLLVLGGLFPESESELDLLEDALRRSGNIESTARSKSVPWGLDGSDAIPLWRNPDPLSPFVALTKVTVSRDYFDTMGMPLLAGRVFSDEFADDLYPAPHEIPTAQGPYSVVIDDGTAGRLGWNDPQQAVGEQLFTSYLPPVVDEPRFVSLTVIGVVSYQALEIANVGVTPTHVFMLGPSEATNIIVRPNSGATREALADIDDVWQQFFPQSRARPEFLDDIFARSYSVFEVIGYIFAALAFFSFAISTIGLVGMTTFIVRSRRREVVIRRIHGAGRHRILRMLVTDFLKPVLVANLAAWPIGFALASVYLSVFYVRTPVSPIPFLLSLTLSLAIAVLAVIQQAQRSANVPPATILKHE